MIDALKFVRGAVATKDFQPALTHFLIENGRVLGYDGIIALSSPIDIDIHAAPKAIPFVKAIERCESETTSINLTETGKITLRSGRRRFTIECTEDKEVLGYIQPEGEDVPTPQGLLEAVRCLSPYIATDASREWSNGILLRGFSAYATNNVILAQYWLGEAMPGVNLPASAITELKRIGEAPQRIQISSTSATFHFSGDRWLRTQLLEADWADVDSMLDAAFNNPDNPPILSPLPEQFFSVLDTVTPFTSEKPKRVMFREGAVTTSLSGEPGASVEVEGLPSFGTYNLDMLKLLDPSATHVDFTKHPKPCPFIGTNLRAVIMGMHEG